jgi:hypothetical protein
MLASEERGNDDGGGLGGKWEQMLMSGEAGELDMARHPAVTKCEIAAGTLMVKARRMALHG